MKYKKRPYWKYTLEKKESYPTGIKGSNTKQMGLVRLTEAGVLHIGKGYTWDGPSGPTFDTKTFMRGSLIHDVLYQLMREGKLSIKERQRADEILREICLADGMLKIRAWWVYESVRRWGGKSALPDMKEAP